MLKWLKKVFVPHEHNGYHPHFLRHQSISVILLLVIVIEVGFFVQIFYVYDKTKFLAAVLPGVLTNITNAERAEAGLAPLTENALLSAAAQLKAQDMAAKSYFAHVSPEGLTPWHWFEQVNYKYVYAGENLAVNFFESADVARAWMNSPTHKANIVKPGYTEIGIGVASGIYQGHNTVFVAQLFGTPLVAPAPVAPAPTSEVAVAEEPEAPAPTPEETVVLGEETTTAEPPVEIPEVVASEAPMPVLGGETIILEDPTPENVEDNLVPSRETPLKITIEKTLTSPRRSVNYAYGTIGLFAALAVALALMVRKELRHPGMVARGVGVIAVIIVLSIINLKILEVAPTVPTDVNLSANAIEALP